MVVKHNLALGRTVLSRKVFFTVSNKLFVIQIQFLDTLTILTSHSTGVLDTLIFLYKYSWNLLSNSKEQFLG